MYSLISTQTLHAFPMISVHLITVVAFPRSRGLWGKVQRVIRRQHAILLLLKWGYAHSIHYHSFKS